MYKACRNYDLKFKLGRFSDWSAVEPLEYMSPFLEVIRSPETSGALTCRAALWICHLGSRRLCSCKSMIKQAPVKAMVWTMWNAGPITICALGAVRRVLDQNVLGEPVHVTDLRML